MLDQLNHPHWGFYKSYRFNRRMCLSVLILLYCCKNKRNKGNLLDTAKWLAICWEIILGRCILRQWLSVMFRWCVTDRSWCYGSSCQKGIPEASVKHHWLEIMCCRNIINFHDHDHSDMVHNNWIIHLGLITAAQECWCMLRKFYPLVSVTGSDASGKSFYSQLSCCITDAPSRMPDDHNPWSTFTETVTDG